MSKVWISELHFSDKSKIAINENDIVVLVGPNNSGKSATLKETASLLRNKEYHIGKVVRDIEFELEGETDDLISFLDENYQREYNKDSSDVYTGIGINVAKSDMDFLWKRSPLGLMNLSSIFFNSLSTEERLKSANAPSSIKITTQAPSHPIHYLQKDDRLEYKFSGYFKQAFGTDLIVHRNAGNQVPLYVGNRPIPKEGEDRVSKSYLEKLEQLDLLQAQGDGMRSFVGVLLNAFISSHSILFIDEPEAFLHPPQARLLGKMLAKDLPAERQLFLATHSEYFLKGLLDANPANLKIIRLQRKSSINCVSVLNKNDINNIWKDSLLRHSNILSGLFHSKVIICESDSDCRFFSAILDSKFDNSDDVSPDVLFVHCGGKHRIPTAVKALRKIEVPVAVIADFDVLNGINPIKYIFEDLGGDWSEVEKDWILVKNEIESKKPALHKDELKEKIDEIFASTSNRIFPSEKISEVSKTLKKGSAWNEAKSIGKAYIPSGNATQAFERMQSKFQALGFFILEVGELESFIKNIGGHGPKWVNNVLSKNLSADPDLRLAREFIEKLIG